MLRLHPRPSRKKIQGTVPMLLQTQKWRIAVERSMFHLWPVSLKIRASYWTKPLFSLTFLHWYRSTCDWLSTHNTDSVFCILIPFQEFLDPSYYSSGASPCHTLTIVQWKCIAGLNFLNEDQENVYIQSFCSPRSKQKLFFKWI